ncbi:MAG: purine-nucleoside phosphorylase [Bacteroidota bacterium]|nr:purine-nucleoside phosphorylase [Bacteroidota bacterium]
MLKQIEGTVNFIKDRITSDPEVGIILGTGLGGLVNEIDINETLSYDDIPDFPVSTVEGHHGRLIFGTLNGKSVVAMQGRFHYYEGYSAEKITFPVRVMKFLGIKHLFVSNASGGINPDFEIGDLMVINDHINLIPNPLIGKHEKGFGPRFPDMSNVYDPNLISTFKQIAKKHDIKLQEGVYTVVTGPTFETPAEYKYFRIIGSDTVGMSTVPEVIVAHQMGIPVFAVSIITDLGVPGKIMEVSHEEVQRVASKAEKKMTLLIKEMMGKI